MKNIKLIFVCSPYKGDIENNTENAKRYCRFVYRHGNVPYAPHLHNSAFLDEDSTDERKAAIELGIEILKRSDEFWIFGNKLTLGMKQELQAAKSLGKTIKYLEDTNGKITFSSFRRC